MGCVRRLRFTSLVLFLYLVRLSDSNVCSARTVVGVVENDSEERRAEKGLQRETSNWLWGRRSTAEGLEKDLGTDCRSTRKILESAPTPTAQRNTKRSLDEQPLESSTTDQHTAAFNHLSSYDSFQKITESKGQPDAAAVTEMHTMVHMDYQRRARRKPPINNGFLPLKQGQLHAEEP